MKLIILAVLISIAECNVGGVDQRVVVKGRLLCGESAVRGVLVKLFDVDWGKDDLMAKGYTDQDGRFYLNGTENEMGNIDPQLTIFHDCNDRMPCQRKWQWKIPDRYVFRKEKWNEIKIMDIGEWNLEMIMRKEKRDCIH